MYPQKAERTFDVNDPKFSLFSKFADHFNDIVKRSVTHCTKIRDELGVPIADEKLVGPIHVLTFLGLEIDTDEMMVRIPQSKMNALVEIKSSK
jgi:hypothetical protein